MVASRYLLAFGTCLNYRLRFMLGIEELLVGLVRAVVAVEALEAWVECLEELVCPATVDVFACLLEVTFLPFLLLPLLNDSFSIRVK